MRVAILVYDGFDELDALAPYEVFRVAEALGADLRAELVTLDGAEEVVAQHGLRLRPAGRLDAPPDVPLVPGGGWNARTPTGAWAEAQRGTLPAAIARLHREGVTLATVCTGGMLAARAGVLCGRRGTTHHRALEELRASGADVVAARVVDDGDIISSGGVTSGLDLALWLVERYAGPATAAAVERTLEYERRGTVWRPPIVRGVARG